MSRFSRLLLLLVLFVATTVDAKRVVRAAPGSTKTGHYIVKLHDDTSHAKFEELAEKILEESVDRKIHVKVEGSVSKIITADLPEDALDRVRL